MLEVCTMITAKTPRNTNERAKQVNGRNDGGKCYGWRIIRDGAGYQEPLEALINTLGEI